MNQQQFEQLMATVAQGWNTKNPQLAVDCFTDNAIYLEPPDKQLIQGKKELFQYFGGDQGIEMTLTWHHLFFNQQKQSGAGEYTFEMNGKTHHGVVIVDLEDSKIKFWREYDLVSDLKFEDFINIEGKNFQFTSRDL